VPLAAVLYSGGISFGGVISFMFADLIIIPILFIYRKYYGTKMTLVLLGGFYVTMVIGGYLVELLFGGLGLVPDHAQATVVQTSITWNYTTILNLVALALTAVLLVRFYATGGREMLAMMGGSPEEMNHDHGGHDHPVQTPGESTEHEGHGQAAGADHQGD
jgi:uncharacterized membrane protein YraQ (UPF0718 family)